MSRPRSDDRRTALLHAAATVFAEHGLAAPTALISKTAGVSEGSFFTYFATKDDLINALYRELRGEMASALLQAYPRRSGVRERLAHVWARWVAWGVADPVARKALKHLTMSNLITDDVRAESGVLFVDIEQLQEDAADQRRLHLPPVLVSQALRALAEMTMDLIERYPDQSAALTATGFRMLWGALTSKPAERPEARALTRSA
jgi:AcrR family transcriptional regulator